MRRRQHEPAFDEEKVVMMEALVACWVAGEGIAAPKASTKKSAAKGKGKGKAKAKTAPGSSSSGGGEDGPAPLMTRQELLALCAVLREAWSEQDDDGEGEGSTASGAASGHSSRAALQMGLAVLAKGEAALKAHR